MRNPISRLATTESDTTRSVMLINALFIIQMLFSVYTLSVVLVLPAKERDIFENIKKNRKYLSKNGKFIARFDKFPSKSSSH